MCMCVCMCICVWGRGYTGGLMTLLNEFFLSFIDWSFIVDRITHSHISEIRQFRKFRFSYVKLWKDMHWSNFFSPVSFLETWYLDFYKWNWKSTGQKKKLRETRNTLVMHFLERRRKLIVNCFTMKQKIYLIDCFFRYKIYNTVKNFVSNLTWLDR